MRRARLISLSCFLAVVPAQATAQWQATADAGAAHLRQPDIPESNASTFGASVDALGDAAWFRSSLLAARTASNRWTAQGVAVASLLGPLQRGTRFELSGSISGFSEMNGNTTTSGEGMARVHVGERAFGGALGIGAGYVNADGGGGGLFHAQTDLWRIVGDDRFIGSASFVNTQSGLPLDTTRTRRIAYADVSASWRRDRGALSVGATGGMRVGRSAGWGSADATLWVLPHAALVAAVGRSLEDVTRGVPRTQYASFAIRVAVRPQPSLHSTTPQVRGPIVVASREFLEVRVRGASSVEVMGDFTEWEPVELVPGGDAFGAPFALSTGSHRMVVRLDGGDWAPAANTPAVDDDFGGKVGLLLVP